MNEIKKKQCCLSFFRIILKQTKDFPSLNDDDDDDDFFSSVGFSSPYA